MRSPTVVGAKELEFIQWARKLVPGNDGHVDYRAQGSTRWYNGVNTQNPTKVAQDYAGLFGLIEVEGITPLVEPRWHTTSDHEASVRAAFQCISWRRWSTAESHMLARPLFLIRAFRVQRGVGSRLV